MEKYLKADRSILSKIKRKVIGLLPRKFQCYCIGAEKTGTTTIYSMHNHNYRCSHEADPHQTMQLVIDYKKGGISKPYVSDILKKRDVLLNLEMESAHHLVYVSDILVEIFPKAKFIITIREPYNHLESRLNWHRTPNHPAWNNYMNYFLKRHHKGYNEEENLLREYNLYSLDTFLRQYSDHYQHVFNCIPKEKRIIIKTRELNTSIDKIASFLHIKKASIKVAHSNKRKNKIPLLKQMDQHFVRAKIWEHCGDLIQKFFPETLHFYKQ